MKVLIGLFAVTSAACEVFGTWTVWRSFKRTADVAEQIRKHLIDDAETLDIEANSPREMLGQDSAMNIGLHLTAHRVKTIENLSPIVERLNWDRLTVWGLAAYILGAILGAIAALVAL